MKSLRTSETVSMVASLAIKICRFCGSFIDSNIPARLDTLTTLQINHRRIENNPIKITNRA